MTEAVLDPQSYRLPSGEDLRTMREQLGLSQRDAAEQAGIGSHRTVGRLESGDRYNRETIEQLLETYRELWNGPVRDVVDADQDDEDQPPIDELEIPIDVAARGKVYLAYWLFEERGYSGQQVSDQLGISAQTVYQYANDVRAGRRS